MNDRTRKRATLSKRVVDGFEKMLREIRLTPEEATDKDTLAALHYMRETVRLYHTPGAAERRAKVREEKRLWVERQKEK